MTAVAAELAEPEFLDDRLAHWAEATPDGEAFTYLGRTWTWAAWEDRVRRLAGALTSLGIGRGDVVSFLDKNHPACVELTLAAASLGAANAIINFRLAGDEVDYAVNDSGAKVLLVGSELMPLIEKIRDRLDGVEKIIEVTPEGGDDDEYEALLAASDPTGRDPQVEPDDVCLVMYSSGTTGRPKGVTLTQANMIAHTVNAHEGWGFDEGDKNMVAMPLFHVGGSSYVLFGIHDGVPSVMTRDPDGASLAGAIMQGANRTFLVPAVLAQVLQSGDDAVKLFGQLKTYCYGAAPMPMPLLRAAIKAWPDTDFIQVYGLTEVCGVITHLLPEAHRDEAHPERLVSAGQCIPGVEVKVVDPESLEDVGDGRARRAVVPDGAADEGLPQQARRHRGGDHRGRLVPHRRHGQGRRRGLRLRRGPAQGHDHQWRGEHLLARDRARAGRAPLGHGGRDHRRAPTSGGARRSRRWSSLKPDTEATEDELIAYCREHLAKYKCPTSVDILEALPRNPTGKILKRDLRKPYWDGRDRTTV